MTRYEWDSADRLARIVLPGGKSKSFEYNGYGEPTKVVDENGQVTRFDYHQHTDLVSLVTQPDGSSLQYDYHNAKNFVSTITNERGESYFIDYYPNGLVQGETTFDGRFNIAPTVMCFTNMLKRLPTHCASKGSIMTAKQGYTTTATGTTAQAQVGSPPPTQSGLQAG